MVGFALLCFDGMDLHDWHDLHGETGRGTYGLRGGGDVRGGEGGRSVHSELNWWFVRCRSGD